MSAFNEQPAFWSRIFGVFRAPVARSNTAATHLQSMSPESAACLMGPGSVPPKPCTPVANAISTAVQPSKLSLPSPNALPWPLLRTTGVFQDLHAQTDRALALSTINLVAQLSEEISAIASASNVAAVMQRRNFAGQLAVVARLNQPAARTSVKATAKAQASRKAAKSAYIQKRALASVPASTAKPAHEIAAKPQALIIDLAAAKKLRRAEKPRRAA